jgi:hypothetical protein
VPSAAVGPFTLPAPTVSAPDGTLQTVLIDADGAGDANDLPLVLDGIAGQTVQVYVNGFSTGNLHALTGAPLERVVYDTTPGEHVIGVQYVDPVTLRPGRLVTFTLTALEPVV